MYIWILKRKIHVHLCYVYKNFWKVMHQNLMMVTFWIVLGDPFFYILFLNVQIAHNECELFALSGKWQFMVLFRIDGSRSYFQCYLFQPCIKPFLFAWNVTEMSQEWYYLALGKFHFGFPFSLLPVSSPSWPQTCFTQTCAKLPLLHFPGHWAISQMLSNSPARNTWQEHCQETSPGAFLDRRWWNGRPWSLVGNPNSSLSWEIAVSSSWNHRAVQLSQWWVCK